jgi:hypothetical protein
MRAQKRLYLCAPTCARAGTQQTARVSSCASQHTPQAGLAVVVVAAATAAGRSTQTSAARVGRWPLAAHLLIPHAGQIEDHSGSRRLHCQPPVDDRAEHEAGATRLQQPANRHCTVLLCRPAPPPRAGRVAAHIIGRLDRSSASPSMRLRRTAPADLSFEVQLKGQTCAKQQLIVATDALVMPIICQPRKFWQAKGKDTLQLT